MITRRLAITAVLALSTACGAAPVGRRDAFHDNERIAALNKALAEAEKKEAPVYAPDGFASASALLDEAISEQSAGDVEDATEAAEKGLALVPGIEASTAKFAEAMAEVIATRARAVKEQAPSLYADAFDESEKALKNAARLVESGKVEDALALRPGLVAAYSDLELRALKAGTVAAAKAAIAEAEKDEVEKYAPRTFRLAVEEVKLVTSVLEADRTQTAKASLHARKTVWLARRAQGITRVVKEFENRDLSHEEIALWYQDQLDQATEPLGGELPFDEENAKVVSSVRGDLAEVVRERDDAISKAKLLEGELAASKVALEKQRAQFVSQVREILNADQKEFLRLKKKYADMLSTEAAAQAEVDGAELERRQKFEEVKKSFDAGEAEVTLEDRDVRIRAFGIQFAPKSTEVEARNFALIDKIAQVIQKYPDAKIVVSAHTESKGNAKKNTALSKKRAANVAKFLTDVAKIPKERVSAEGLGSVKPIADNDTPEGRERNRRIEILIVNH